MNDVSNTSNKTTDKTTDKSTKKIRVHDLSMSFRDGERVLLRSTSTGKGALVPPTAVGVLAMCDIPRSREEVAGYMGPHGAALFSWLEESGFLVDPSAAMDTPVFFDNFSGLDVHRRMLEDEARLGAYRAAIQELVAQGDVVLDAGTGSGVLACMAALAGAQTVYGVDNSDLMDAAQLVVDRSGLQDKVKLLRGDFRAIKLPEQVDLVVTETFGALALAEGAAFDLKPCVENNLKPEGVVIPHAVELWLAPVGDRGLFDESIGVFDPYDGIDFTPLRDSALRRGRSVEVSPEMLLHDGLKFATIPFPSREMPAAQVTYGGLRPGVITGMVGWFVLRLSQHVSLATGPFDAMTHWKQVYLPWEPMEAAAGTSLTVDVELEHAPDDRRSLDVHMTWRLGEVGGDSHHRLR